MRLFFNNVGLIDLTKFFDLSPQQIKDIIDVNTIPATLFSLKAIKHINKH